MSTERKYHRRCFLNDESGAAIVESYLDDHSYLDRTTGERHPNYDGVLHITDCSRSIELSFSIGRNVDDLRGDLRKLDRLIDVAQGLRDAMVRAAKREFPGKKF